MSFQARSLWSSLAVLLLVVGSGCGVVVTRGGMVSVPSVVLDGGVTLEAEDPPEFVLRPERSVATPFESSCRRAWANRGEGLPTIANWDSYRDTRRVRVNVPGRTTPLHGLLAFCGVHPSFRGAVSRSYRLSVPPSYVEATSGGRISVVYEQYNAINDTFPAWILWLSEEPFPARTKPSQPAAAAARDAEERS